MTTATGTIAEATADRIWTSRLLPRCPEGGAGPETGVALDSFVGSFEGGDDEHEAPFALFAFAATLPFHLSVEDSDVSPGYAERTPARTIALRLAGKVPASIWTAVLVLAGEGMPSFDGATKGVVPPGET